MKPVEEDRAYQQAVFQLFITISSRGCIPPPKEEEEEVIVSGLSYIHKRRMLIFKIKNSSTTTWIGGDPEVVLLGFLRLFPCEPDLTDPCAVRMHVVDARPIPSES